MYDPTGGCFNGFALVACLVGLYGIGTLVLWPITGKVPHAALELITSPLGWTLSIMGFLGGGILVFAAVLEWLAGGNFSSLVPGVLMAAASAGLITFQLFARRALKKNSPPPLMFEK